MKSMSRCCPECEEILRGRSDKKFCSDTCRSAHYHRNNRPDNGFRQVNTILLRNQRILQKLFSLEKKQVSRTRLLLEGFDFRHCTAWFTNPKGNTYYYCYNLGYLLLNEDRVVLVQNKDWPDEKSPGPAL